VRHQTPRTINRRWKKNEQLLLQTLHAAEDVLHHEVDAGQDASRFVLDHPLKGRRGDLGKGDRRSRRDEREHQEARDHDAPLGLVSDDRAKTFAV
jgi:hypothetical protein